MSAHSTPDLLKRLVNKMLEKHNVNYEYVLENPKIEGKDWFSYFTVTKEEAQEFKKFAIAEIKKAKRCGKHYAENYFNWFNFYCGLKIVDGAGEENN